MRQASLRAHPDPVGAIAGQRDDRALGKALALVATLVFRSPAVRAFRRDPSSIERVPLGHLSMDLRLLRLAEPGFGRASIGPTRMTALRRLAGVWGGAPSDLLFAAANVMDVEPAGEIQQDALPVRLTALGLALKRPDTLLLTLPPDADPQVALRERLTSLQHHELVPALVIWRGDEPPALHGAVGLVGREALHVRALPDQAGQVPTRLARPADHAQVRLGQGDRPVQQRRLLPGPDRQGGHQLVEAPRLERVREKLRLPRLPRRIECVDISHSGGTDTVAVFVALVDGAPLKSGYRSFRVKTVSGGAAGNETASSAMLLTDVPANEAVSYTHLTLPTSDLV